MTRRRFVTIDGVLTEVPLNWSRNAPQAAYYIQGDKLYENTRSPIDGADISSRTKHRQYMKEKGLTTIDDYTNHFSKIAEQKAEFMATGRDSSRPADVRDAYDKHTRRK
jgi:hypothetical protein